MNINQMMRSFLGETASSDTRAMELKSGQMVRGVVLQVMENNEALVQINGVQVRAKLETPLQAGQAAIMQVQPQTNDSLVVLKQVEPGAAGLPEDTFKEWAKQLVLPETKWAVALVKDLRKEGVVLTREVAQAFQQAVAAMPGGADTEQWMLATAAAFKRGLPMSGATIASLQQVMFGRSAHELLDALQQQLASAMSGAVVGNEAEANAAGKPLSQAAARVLTLLAEGTSLMRSATTVSDGADTLPSTATTAKAGTGVASTDLAGSSSARTGAAVSDEGAQQQQLQAARGGEAARTASASVLHAVANGSVTVAEQTDQGVSPMKGTAPPATNWLGNMMKWLGVDYELQLSKALTAEPQTLQPVAAQISDLSEKASATHTARPAATPPATTFMSAGAVAARSADMMEPASTAGQAATTPPVSNDKSEQQNIRLTEMRLQADRVLLQTSGQAAMVLPGGMSSTEPALPTQQQDSLKSALLSLIASDDIPPAIKETAQQLVQQITGQQLLLTPERNSSVFTHVTMFIPLNSQDGNQTASVHIQTRRGRKGELDASNCRLLFNLSMKTLGVTMVDVNVTDKIVSLNLWNDHPAIAELAHSSRAEIAESLHKTGYQLLSLRTTPLPKADDQNEDGSLYSPATKQQQPPDISQFGSTRYRGVDFRI